MRKGDETKREILRAAEQLFCQKGYEAASMQEIVRAAGVSKGGIYHHFASKEEIMTLLSHQHAQESAERAEAQLADAPDDLARLNLLLMACLPMRDEDAAFTAMLLPMATSPEGRAMALTYLDALSDRFHPLLEQTIAQGVQSGTLFTEIRGVAGIVLHLLIVSSVVARVGGITAGHQSKCHHHRQQQSQQFLEFHVHSSSIIVVSLDIYINRLCGLYRSLHHTLVEMLSPSTVKTAGLE